MNPYVVCLYFNFFSNERKKNPGEKKLFHPFKRHSSVILSIITKMFQLLSQSNFKTFSSSQTNSYPLVVTVHSLLTPNPRIHCLIFCLCGLACSGHCKWNYMKCDLKCLTSFIDHNLCPKFFHFVVCFGIYTWIILHFIYPFVNWWAFGFGGILFYFGICVSCFFIMLLRVAFTYKLLCGHMFYIFLGI